jgi:hypothetical protein
MFIVTGKRPYECLTIRVGQPITAHDLVAVLDCSPAHDADHQHSCASTSP